MCVRPQRPVELDFGTSRDFGVERSRRGARSTASCVATALQVGEGDVLDGAVALNRARDTLGFRVGVWVGVRLVELVVLTADQGSVDIAVSRNSGGKSQSWSDVLHCDQSYSVRDDGSWRREEVYIRGSNSSNAIIFQQHTSTPR